MVQKNLESTNEKKYEVEKDFINKKIDEKLPAEKVIFIFFAGCFRFYVYSVTILQSNSFVI